MRRYSKKEVGIDSDGTTVWVNVADGCIARFGRQGIDIHNPPLESTRLECLLCTHGPTTLEDWDHFVGAMLRLYGILVPQEHMPERFRCLPHTNGNEPPQASSNSASSVRSIPTG